ncbi:MAG: type III-B CRISPR module RAMP protein Cmr6 [Micromonosporaceae bacterium]
MTLPLYRLPKGMTPMPGDSGHRGLWYDKFCDQWRYERSPGSGRGNWSLKSDGSGSPKLKWISQFEGAVGSKELLEAYANRLADLIEARGGKWVIATARSRFVTGLGRSHPVENGFAWHPTLGTPYLAGSSLKGLTHAWALGEFPRHEVEEVLGTAGSVGKVGFLDAVPVAPVELEADVLTPHYANWTEQEPPGDWRSPSPVPFLVAARGLPMIFGVVPTCSVGRQDVARVFEWMTSALDSAGAGAKTAIGYGQFTVDEEHPFAARRREARRQREAQATPTGRWRQRLAGCTEEELLSAVREHLIENPLSDPDERRAFVQVIVETGKVASWRRGEKTEARTGTGGRKLRERGNAVRAAAEDFGIELPQ